MFHKEKPDYHRCQYGFYTIDELVPEDHFLRQLESEVDFDFMILSIILCKHSSRVTECYSNMLSSVSEHCPNPLWIR